MVCSTFYHWSSVNQMSSYLAEFRRGLTSKFPRAELQNLEMLTTDESLSYWQTKCLKVRQRTSQLYQLGKWTDCVFKVGADEATVSAHRLVLAISSPVFEAMLYGALAHKDNAEPIAIPDMQLEAFNALLLYIYTDMVTITSYSVACELYNVGQKYMLPKLKSESLQYLQTNLTPDNAGLTYEFAQLFDEEQLADQCLQVIRRNTLKVLKSDSFTKLQIDTVAKIFSLEPLNIMSELDLAYAAVEYTTYNVKDMETAKHLESSTNEGIIERVVQKINAVLDTAVQSNGAVYEEFVSIINAGGQIQEELVDKNSIEASDQSIENGKDIKEPEDHKVNVVDAALQSNGSVYEKDGFIVNGGGEIHKELVNKDSTEARDKTLDKDSTEAMNPCDQTVKKCSTDAVQVVSEANVKDKAADEKLKRDDAIKTKDDPPELPIRKAVKHIRFLTMEPQEFSEHDFSPILSQAEILAILLNLNSKKTYAPMPMGFSTNRKSRIQIDRKSDAEYETIVFRTMVNKVSSISKHDSPTYYARNLPCRLITRIWDQVGKRNLSVYLYCNWKDKSTWSCHLQVTVKLLSNRVDTAPICQELEITFGNPGRTVWGCVNFSPWSNVMAPENGFVTHDSIIWEVKIRAKQVEREVTATAAAAAAAAPNP